MKRNNSPVMTGTKTCKNCEKTQPVTEFYPHKTMGDGRLSKCRTCTKKHTNEWRKVPGNRQKWNAQRHKKLSMRQHGLTSDEYDALAAVVQCPGCGRTREEVGRVFAVDHEHDTGRVRGALCYECNLVLGNAHDNAQTLKNLADYLTQPH